MEIDTLKEMIEKSNNIVFFGGAGVSTESGIPDFRTDSGIYNQKSQYSYPPEVMLSHSFFMEHTEEFFKFYKDKMIYKDVKPNAAHTALAELERRGKLKAVITQNIDGLHQTAGSENVIELHGSVHRNNCMNCNESYNLDYVLNSPKIVPECSKCNGIVKPCVILYEEPLDTDSIDRAVAFLERADMLIVGGTSLAVYPAAGLIQYYRGDRLVLINKSPTPYDSRANLIIRDSIGAVLRTVI